MPEIARQDLPDGLSTAEADARLARYGRNALPSEGQKKTLILLRDMATEPMFLILAAACILYFALGEWEEGIMMGVAISIVSAISFYQDRKSTNALAALQEYMAPTVTVRRQGIESNISVDKLVPGDVIRLEEGDRVPADAEIIQANDLSVNESLLTGESLPVDKGTTVGNLSLFQGTLINSGTCYSRVSATGTGTRLAGIGKSIRQLETPDTPLQIQINKFVRRLAGFGITGFLVVCVINYLRTQLIVESLLRGLTIAMSAIPEEIPVAFTSFMALGAYYLARRGIITRNPMTVENLGRASVVCLDKTGTITQNKMEVSHLYDYTDRALTDVEKSPQLGPSAMHVLVYARLASEATPFDAMEAAIVKSAQRYGALTNGPPPMCFEYPLGGTPPMMTHVYDTNSYKTAAAKGALERIIAVCHLEPDDATRILEEASRLAGKGHRVLGIAEAAMTGNQYPQNQDDFNWKFLGFITLFDPPKPNLKAVLDDLYAEGIQLNLVTGDYPQTAMSIARQVHWKGTDSFLTGEEVMRLPDEALRQQIHSHTIFARMFPEAKLKLIEALRSSGNIVAMTGDGVNDGPALKAADIGIAMGKRGTETARQAASLVITNDDLASIPEAIRQGRKIYGNLKKATRYIVSIHIPIILMASLPLLFGWQFPNLFTPIHVIFLELIMGPTCSIFFEREPPELNASAEQGSLFSRSDTFLSISTGVLITLSLLFLQYAFTSRGYDLLYVRSLVFITLIVSNLFLTFAYRSAREPIWKTIHYKNALTPYVLALSVAFIAAIQLLPAVRELFGLALISMRHLGWCITLGAVSVIWFEIIKATYRVFVGPDQNQTVINR